MRDGYPPCPTCGQRRPAGATCPNGHRPAVRERVLTLTDKAVDYLEEEQEAESRQAALEFLFRPMPWAQGAACGSASR